MTRLPGLDGIRATAILLVVACHAGLPFFLVGGGVAGVSVFFVLSGFLITTLLSHPQLGVTEFWVKRAIRLVPALVAMLMILAVFWLAIGDGPGTFAPSQALSLSFAANWFPLSSLGSLLHLWSLSVEVQIYLLWPAVIRRVNPGRLPAVLATLAIVSLAIRAVVDHGHSVRGTDTNLYAFALGALVAVAWADRRTASMAVAPLAILLVTVATIAPRNFSQDGFLGIDFRWQGPCAAIGAAGLIWAAVSRDWSVPAWTAYIAKVSYGWYLWHLPLMLLYPVGMIGRLGAAFVALLCAAASYRWIEEPTRVLLQARLNPRAGRASDHLTV